MSKVGCLFCTGPTESAYRVKETNALVGTLSYTPFCEGKHKEKDAMPVCNSRNYISLVTCTL